MLGAVSDNLLLLAVAAAAALCYAAVLLVLFRRDPVAQRIEAVVQQRTPRRAVSVVRKQAAQENMAQIARHVVERLHLVRTQRARMIADRLAQAGWRRPDAAIIYLFAKVCMPMIFAALAVGGLYGLNLFKLGPMTQALAALGAVLVGSYAPEILIRNAVQRRSHELRKALPDALDLLVVCAEAGLALDAALDRVAREIGGTSEAMADELGHTVLEMRFLPERRKALENLTRRTDVPGIQALVNTLIQTERFGTPLAQSLRVLSAEMRTQRMVRAEEKAARLPAIMTVPLIIFILPALFVVLMGPAVLDLIDTFRTM